MTRREGGKGDGTHWTATVSDKSVHDRRQIVSRDIELLEPGGRIGIQRGGIAMPIIAFVFSASIPLEGVTVVPNVSLATFLGGGLAFLVFCRQVKKRTGLSLRRKDVLVVVFSLLCWVGALRLPGSTVFGSLKFIFPVMIFYFTILFLVDSVRILKAVTVGLIFGVLLSAGLAAAGGYLWSQPSPEARFLGQVGDPNEFSVMLAAIAPLALGLLAWGRKRWLRCVGLLATLSMSLSVLLTYSRTGAVLLCFAAMYMVISLVKTREYRWVPPVVFIGILVIYSVPPGYGERLSALYDRDRETGGSIRARKVQAKAALQAFAEHPLVGIGLAGVPTYASRYSAYPDIAIHNAYLDVLSGTGLTGFIPMVAILLLSLRSFNVAERNFRHSKEYLLHQQAVVWRGTYLVSLLSLLFLSMVTNKIFWLTWAISSVFDRWSESQVCGQ